MLKIVSMMIIISLGSKYGTKIKTFSVDFKDYYQAIVLIKKEIALKQIKKASATVFSIRRKY